MSYPVGPAPDGAFVVGSRYGQDLTPDKVMTTIKTPVLNPWSLAQINFWDLLFQRESALADIKDGQNQYADQVALLEASSGHAAMVMSKNWNVPFNRWVVLPFDTQMGPVKNAAAGIPQRSLVIKQPGLWRIDALATTEGEFTEARIVVIGGIFTTQYYYHAISTSYMIEVVRGGQLFAARQYDNVGDNTEYLAYTNLLGERSSAFSHTFVIDMPNPADPAQWAYVRMSMRFNPEGGNALWAPRCKTYGGAARCALVASRWSRDAVNLSQPQTVPDGGNLG